MQMSMQEFKSHLAHYVEQAQAGVIELTSHRKVIASIIGVRHSEHAGVARLLAAGVTTWQGGKPQGATLRLQERGRPVSAIVLEDRAPSRNNALTYNSLNPANLCKPSRRLP